MAIIPPEELLEGYSIGIFPMAKSRHDDQIEWYTARRRGIIPLDRFHISRKMKRLIRNDNYDFSCNTRFREVIEGCAERQQTWISDNLIESFDRLHELGYAHSVEVYNKEGKLIGGTYGAALGAAFFAESMFQREKEASKAALYYCHQLLQKGGFELWDVQFYTPHLARFGCIEISDEEYKKRLNKALEKYAHFCSENKSAGFKSLSYFDKTHTRGLNMR